jgi:hypothetical protein
MTNITGNSTQVLKGAGAVDTKSCSARVRMILKMSAQLTHISRVLGHPGMKTSVAVLFVLHLEGG